MFGDLYDEISRLWSWSWPCADGKITEVLGEKLHNHSRKRAGLAVAYEFCVRAHGP